MPRAGQLKPPTGDRLSDRIAIGLLTSTFPPELVDRVVTATGRTEQRSRLLPAQVVVYYVLAMCLFFGQGYEEVARLLTEGLAWSRRWRGSWQVPTTAAITRALGPEPVKALFEAACRPVATPATVGSFYRHWRLVAVDGTTFDLPDTVANADSFGRPGSTRGNGRGAFPQARVAVLAECGTHAIFAAATGPLATHETALARRLFGALGSGMLLLADRGFVGFDLWREAATTGADLLWQYARRMRRTPLPPIVPTACRHTPQRSSPWAQHAELSVRGRRARCRTDVSSPRSGRVRRPGRASLAWRPYFSAMCGPAGRR